MAAQNPPQQHLAGETSLLGTTRSPTAVFPGPPRHQEDSHLLRSIGSPRFLEHQVVGERDSVEEEASSAKSCLQFALATGHF